MPSADPEAHKETTDGRRVWFTKHTPYLLVFVSTAVYVVVQLRTGAGKGREGERERWEMEGEREGGRGRERGPRAAFSVLLDRLLP